MNTTKRCPRCGMFNAPKGVKPSNGGSFSFSKA